MAQWTEQFLTNADFNERVKNPSLGVTLCVLTMNDRDVAHVVGNDENGWSISLRQMPPLTLYPIARTSTKDEAITTVENIFGIRKIEKTI